MSMQVRTTSTTILRNERPGIDRFLCLRGRGGRSWLTAAWSHQARDYVTEAGLQQPVYGTPPARDHHRSHSPLMVKHPYTPDTELGEGLRAWGDSSAVG